MNRAVVILFVCAAAGCSTGTTGTPPAVAPPAGPAPAAPGGERHLANIRQLTHGGENAEAYFSADGSELIFQSTRGDLGCDQIFCMGTDGKDARMISTGKGRTTCAYFFPDGSRIIYASTHLGGDPCPPAPERRVGGRYVWPIFRTYDIFSARPDGSD